MTKLTKEYAKEVIAMADSMDLPDGAWMAMIEEISGHDFIDVIIEAEDE